MLRYFKSFVILILLLTACTAQSAITPTPVEIAKLLATVAISPTANAEEVAATRAAVSPTPNPPTATINPTETPYVGIFIGEAQQEESLVRFTEPIIGPRVALSQPTANVERCITNPIDAPYATAWRTNPTVSQRMGCPIQAGFGFFGEIQIFESGLMYHYPELNAIWAIRTQQSAPTGVYDYLENPINTSTIGIQPPTGLIVPGDIFGDMWLAVAGLREEMGFARTEAQEVALGVQRFQNGTFLLDSPAGQVYALIVDGTVLGPFLTSQTDPAQIALPTPAGTVPESEITEEPEN